VYLVNNPNHEDIGSFVIPLIQPIFGGNPAVINLRDLGIHDSRNEAQMFLALWLILCESWVAQHTAEVSYKP
jgi:hypothetical protein